MNDKSKNQAAQLGLIEAIFTAGESLSLKGRLNLMAKLIAAQEKMNIEEAILVIIDALGGNADKLNSIPVKDRKQMVYLPMADIFEKSVSHLKADGFAGAAEYCEGYAKYLRELPPILPNQTPSDEAYRVISEWEEKKKAFTGSDLQRVRELVREKSLIEKDINIKTTFLLQWIYMSRDIDLESWRPTELPERKSSPIPRPLAGVLDRLVGVLLQKAGLGIIDSHDTVHQLLDEHLPGGSESVDSATFLKLCNLTGPEVYAEIAQLVKARQSLEATSGTSSEDSKLKKMKEDAMRRLAAQEFATKEAARYIKFLNDFQMRLKEEGLDEDEIQARTDDFNRYVFEALRNPERK